MSIEKNGKNHTQQHVLYISGFYNEEQDGVRNFRWSQKQSEIVLISSEIDKNNYKFPFLKLLLGSSRETKIQIIINENQVCKITLQEGWRVYRFAIESWSPEIRINFSTDKAIYEDGRTLAFMFESAVITHKSQGLTFYRKDQKKNAKSDFALNKPFLSAFYYLWYFNPSGERSDRPFSGKWSEGYARALLNPPQYPTLGEYVMNDPDVVETHIDWAADHGIDCFICNWEGMEGHRKFLSENLVHILQGSHEDASESPGKIPYSKIDTTGNGWDAVSQGWNNNGYKIRNLNRMKFSALIESRLIVEEWPPRVDSNECIRAFSNAIVYMAENFFCSQQWQRIDGLPVVYIYEVYSWLGSAEAFETFRRAIDVSIKNIIDPLTGKNYKGVYLIADVVYSYEQNMDRLRIFNAVTGYQPYPPVNTQKARSEDVNWSYYGSELFKCPAFENYHRKFSEWCKKNSVQLIPTVIPKYNDRGVRGAIDNYAYPPSSAKNSQNYEDIRNVNLFKENILSQLRWVSQEINMMNINSWNEWFEDTSIEPVGYFPEMDLPDYFGQGSNVGTFTVDGHDKRVPEKIVIYGHDGHKWIDTPESIRKNGIDISQGYVWVCYGFDYLFGLKELFGITYPNENLKSE